jgi:hypothetical protein
MLSNDIRRVPTCIHRYHYQGDDIRTRILLGEKEGIQAIIIEDVDEARKWLGAKAT